MAGEIKKLHSLKQQQHLNLPAFSMVSYDKYVRQNTLASFTSTRQPLLIVLLEMAEIKANMWRRLAQMAENADTMWMAPRTYN